MPAPTLPEKRAPNGARGATRARAHRDDAAKRIRAVGDRSRTARDLDAFDHFGVEVRRARPDATLGTDTGAIEQDQRSSARQPTHGGHRRLSFGHLIDAGHVLERLHQVRRRRVWISVAVSVAVPAAGAVSMLAADPETVTNSLTNGSTLSSTTPSGSCSTSTGFM